MPSTKGLTRTRGQGQEPPHKKNERRSQDSGLQHSKNAQPPHKDGHDLPSSCRGSLGTKNRPAKANSSSGKGRWVWPPIPFLKRQVPSSSLVPIYDDDSRQLTVVSLFVVLKSLAFSTNPRVGDRTYPLRESNRHRQESRLHLRTIPAPQVPKEDLVNTAEVIALGIVLRDTAGLETP